MKHFYNLNHRYFPILKKWLVSHIDGKKQKSEICRTVSILPMISNFFQKYCLHNYLFLLSAFSQNTNADFGVANSTLHCLLTLSFRKMGKIMYIQRKSFYDVLFIDIPKTFDCLDQGLLTTLLNAYGLFSGSMSSTWLFIKHETKN